MFRYISYICLFLLSLFFLNVPSRAQWWAQNDYSWGSGYSKESLSIFRAISTSTVISINGTFYKRDSSMGPEEIYSAKLPILYSAPFYFISFTPFYYPEKEGNYAMGGKLYYMKSLGIDSDEDYTHLILTAAGAGQKAKVLVDSATKKKSFYLSSFEIQIERNYYDLFFFLASACIFHNFSDIDSSGLLFSSLDLNDMAFMGTYTSINRIPLWTANFQFARNIGDDKTTYLYVGGGRIKLDNYPDPTTATIGTRTRLSPKSSFDFGYNWLKYDGTKARNYYKLYLQVFF